MLWKGLLIMLCLSVVLGTLVGCTGVPKTPATDGSTLEGAEAAEATEPDDGSRKLFYDDRLSVTEFGGTEASAVEIQDQQITSTKVGTGNPDMAVLYHDTATNTLVAVGTGTATLVIDGQAQKIRVVPAPISMLLITGHSLGAGQCGVPAQSVVCQAGQAYSTHGASTLTRATEGMGLGFASSTKPDGLNAFAPNGGGVKGEGSGLAYRWNQLTGEKVWVLNAAVGGSCINEWVPGGVCYEPAITMFKAAMQIMENEMKAGHYQLKDTVVVYHSGANFSYKNVTFTNEILENWYKTMCDGFRKELAIDKNGDGEKEPLDGIGFVPSWSTSSGNSYATDKPTTYFLSASDAYSDLFTAGEAMRNWLTFDAILKNFPPQDYTTQSQPVSMPMSNADLLAEDGTHYSQAAYNAAGLRLAEGIYGRVRVPQPVSTVTLETVDGVPVRDTFELRSKGASQALVLRTDPIYESCTITVSENLEIAFPFVLTAKAEGTGTLTIEKDGTVLKTVTVNVG